MFPGNGLLSRQVLKRELVRNAKCASVRCAVRTEGRAADAWPAKAWGAVVINSAGTAPAARAANLRFRVITIPLFGKPQRVRSAISPANRNQAPLLPLMIARSRSVIQYRRTRETTSLVEKAA